MQLVAYGAQDPIVDVNYETGLRMNVRGPGYKFVTAAVRYFRTDHEYLQKNASKVFTRLLLPSIDSRLLDIYQGAVRRGELVDVIVYDEERDMSSVLRRCLSSIVDELRHIGELDGQTSRPSSLYDMIENHGLFSTTSLDEARNGTPACVSPSS